LHIPSQNVLVTADGASIAELRAMELAQYSSALEMDAEVPPEPL
jgi:hypothetical protein